MILALVVLFIAAKGFLPEHLTNPLRRSQSLPDPEDSPPTPDDHPGATACFSAPWKKD